METVLFLAPVGPDGDLGRSALEGLSAAKALAQGLGGAALAVGLWGDDPKAAADRIAGCAAARFLAVKGPQFAESRYGTDALAAEALCRASQATLVVAGATSRTSRILAGVAHRMGGRIDSHLTGVSIEGGKISVTRWYYRQRMEAVLTRTQRPWVMLVDQGCSPAWTGPAGSAVVETVAAEAGAALLRTKVSGLRTAASGEQTIRPDAALLLVAGAGWTKKQADGAIHPKEAQDAILGFLRLTQASLGGSKSVVDISGAGQAVLPFMTHMNQIGQTGATPRHPKGLATCCHGEEPHVVGWRFINERRAVNLDPGCGWSRGKADVVYVADAFQVMAKVNALLAEKKAV